MKVPRTKLLSSILYKTMLSLLAFIQPVVNFVEAVCDKIIFSIVSVNRFGEHALREATIKLRSSSSGIGLDVNYVSRWGMVLDRLKSVMSLRFWGPSTRICLLSLALSTLSSLHWQSSFLEIGRINSHKWLLFAACSLATLSWSYALLLTRFQGSNLLLTPFLFLFSFKSCWGFLDRTFNHLLIAFTFVTFCFHISILNSLPFFKSDIWPIVCSI